MRVVVGDFETFWSKTHSLTKMSAVEYVMHPDTQVISLSLKYAADTAPKVLFGEAAIRRELESQDWSDTLLVAHNMSGFDCMIFAWRFGVKPKAWGCTLAMARPIYAKTCGVSLAALVTKYSLGVKDNSALVNTQGKRLEQFTDEELAEMEKYNAADSEQCYGLFTKLVPHYDAKELWQIDATIRMLVEPQFVLNRKLLESTLDAEQLRKVESLRRVAQIIPGASTAYVSGDDAEEYVRSQLASAPKFGKLLESLGVEIPTKTSPTDDTKRIPALAKTDEGFISLLEHEDELVAMAAAARLDVKSTLLETRLQMFIDTGKKLRGKLPIPLHYCGADTTGRWSGWLYNPQNLPRIDPKKPKLSDALRKCMSAPPGHKVVVADLSGIELRVNHFLWKVPSSMALYKASPGKADLYVDFASKLYNIAPEEVTKAQRQVGKVAHLGLGFGAGAAAFKKVAKLMGGVDISEGEARAITQRWRDTYEDIVLGWRRCHDLLSYLQSGDAVVVDPWGLVVTEKNAFALPSGRKIRYPALREEPRENGKTEWVYGTGRHQARIYAGKVVENLVQALARDVIAQNAYDVYKQLKLRPSLMVHDELVYVVPEDSAQQVLDVVQRVMRTPPKWWPSLVTWSEGDIAQTYGDAK